MKKNGFKGWKDVCAFTFKQCVKKTGYKAITALISFLIIAVIMAAIIFTAYNSDKNNKEQADKADNYVFPIEEAYIIDGSGYLEGFEQYAALLENKMFVNTEFTYITDVSLKSREELMAAAARSAKETVVIYVSLDEAGYVIEALIPDGSGYDESACGMLTSHMLNYFEINKLTKVLTAEQASEVLKPAISSFETIGDTDSEAVVVIKMIGPMLFGVLLYMMLILYGQNIAKEVSMEKTSKLVETLLISVHPNALITGKVIAVAVSAILQFFIWIASVIAGFAAGIIAAKQFFPEYENSIMMIVQFLRDNIGEDALSVPSVLLAVVIFCLGFIFYSFLAGLSGCLAGRPEEAAGSAAFFQIFVVVSWLISYFSQLMEMGGLVKVIRYIPFTSPFAVPIELVSGTIGIWQGLIVLVILVLFTYLVINLSVKIYKGLVLYTGQKVSFKLIGKILKA